MKTRRVLSVLVMVIAATAASLLLLSALGPAEARTFGGSPEHEPAVSGEIASPPPLALQISAQAVSVTFPTDELWYAHPNISIHPEPARAHEPTELCAEVVNTDLVVRIAGLEFAVAPFGIGVPFEPVGVVEFELPPDGYDRGCVIWVPPEPGPWCVQVRLVVDGEEDQIRQRNIDLWEPLRPGVLDELVFTVGPFTQTTTISFTTVHEMTDWDIWVDPMSMTLPADMAGTAALSVIPTDTAVLGSRDVVVDVEGYVDGEVIGGFRKLDMPPVPLHRPSEPFFAETEIQVWPYPVREGEPVEMCAELVNLSDASQQVAVYWSWAHFGIGLPFRPINGPVLVEVPAEGRTEACIGWVPPVGGQFCVQAMLETLGDVPYHLQFSQRNLDVVEPLEPGVGHAIEFLVGNHENMFTNPDPVTQTVWLETDVYLREWQVTLIPSVLPDMAPDEERWVTMIVTPMEPMPPDETPVLDVRALVDGPEGPRPIGGFRKIYRPPVPIHPFPDPVYAEREISVEPYPPRAGEPTEICVELRNPTDEPRETVVRFSWAYFGIGLPFTPINGPRPVYLPPHSTVRECIHWIPPLDGQMCVQVELEMPGHVVQYSQRNIDVDEPLEPLTPDVREFFVGNPFDHPVTITLGLVPHFPDWGLELSEDVLTNVLPGPEMARTVVLTVTPPLDMPWDGDPVVDVEAFVDGELIGGFRKVYRPPVPIHRPRDPVYAESEIFVHPYPPREREPTEVGVEIRNPTAEMKVVTVTFSAASFGIGLPFEPIHKPITVTVPAEGLVHPAIVWVPPSGGLWCIQVEIGLPGYSDVFWSQRNIDVGEPLEPNVPHAREFLVRNPYTEPVTITLGLIPHLYGWGLELSQDVLLHMEPDEVRGVVLTVTPPDDLPEDGAAIVDVEAYAQGELIGGFRKIFRPPVPIHRPKDPVYAESEIGVDPYPVLPGQPTELSVEVFNPTEHDQVVTATFSVAPFGIGLPFSSTHIIPNPIAIYVPAHGAARGHVVWHPPYWHGKFCVRVTLETEGHEPVWSQRNIDVGEPLEPGQPHTLDFQVGGWPYTATVTVTLGLVNHRDGWGTSLSDESVVVDPGDPVTVSLTVTPALDTELGTGAPIVDVEGYVDGVLIGGFRKLDIPPIPLHKPHEKGYAESEIIIDPYPPQVGQDSWVGTVVQNNDPDPITVTLEFGWAKFGMGIPFTDIGMVPPTRTVSVPGHLTQTIGVTWTPTMSGHQCVMIDLRDEQGHYEPQVSQRNVDVVERPPCGQTKVFTFTVYNDSPSTVTVDIGLITFNVPPSWQVSTEPTDTLEIGPFSEGVVTVTVKIGCGTGSMSIQTLSWMYAVQAASGSVATIDVEAYVEGDLRGGIEIQFEGQAVYEIMLPIVLRQYR